MLTLRRAWVAVTVLLALGLALGVVPLVVSLAAVPRSFAAPQLGQARPTPTPFRNIPRTPLPFVSSGDKLTTYSISKVVMEDGQPVTGFFTVDMNNYHVTDSRIVTGPDTACCGPSRAPGSPIQPGNMFPGTTYQGGGLMNFVNSFPCDLNQGLPNESAPCTFPAPAQFDFFMSDPQTRAQIHLTMYVPAFDPRSPNLTLADWLEPSVDVSGASVLRQSALIEWPDSGAFNGYAFFAGARSAHAGTLTATATQCAPVTLDASFSGPSGPVRVVESSDGTLYAVRGAYAWALVPDQASDSDAAALDPRGQIDGTLPHELLVVRAAGAGPIVIQVPVRIVVTSDGSLYLVQGANSWTLVPDQATDSDTAALRRRGEIDGALPNELFDVAPTPDGLC